MKRQQSWRAGLSLFTRVDLARIQQQNRPLDLSVDALLPHLELASWRMMLFRAFTSYLVLQMCVLYYNVLSR